MKGFHQNKAQQYYTYFSLCQISTVTFNRSIFLEALHGRPHLIPVNHWTLLQKCYSEKCLPAVISGCPPILPNPILPAYTVKVIVRDRFKRYGLSSGLGLA